MARRAVVIGGGLAGLVAARDLYLAGFTVTVFESSDRWGGKILSSPVGDRMVDAGPDSMLARVDSGRQLCRELGLDDQLVHPSSAIGAFLHLDGELKPLPPTVLGVPIDLDRLDGVISGPGRQAALVDLETPWRWPSHDPSVGEVCRARLGSEITDRLVDPLLGGINASDIDRLSLRSAAPLLADALDQEGSLIRGLQVRAKAGAALGSAQTPVFYGLKGGMATMIDALVAELSPPPRDHGPTDGQNRGVAPDLRLNHPVASIEEACAAVDGPVDTIIVATPAFATAPLLAGTAPEAARALADIDYASVAQVTVELAPDAVGTILDTSGILFPRVGGTVLTACTWFSSKWRHYHRPDRILLRLTSGRYGDDRIDKLDDDALTDTLLDEVSDSIGLRGRPIAQRFQRWNRSLPQYSPGHHQRVETARAALNQTKPGDPTIHLVGATYDGIGIPAVITSARRGASQAIESRS